MIVEVAAFVAVFLLCWYFNFRPQSKNQLRPFYRSCRTPEEVPRCDYVVVGAGAAGLAAVAALLHRTSDDTHVLLIEGGPDPQPTSALTLLLSAGRRDRLLSFAPDLVNVPAEAYVRGVHPTFLGLPTPDEGYLVQRPWHFSTAEEAVAVTAATADGATAAAAEAKAHRYRLLQYTPFPRGVGVGGTSLVDWDMHLNSIWPAHGDSTITTTTTATTSKTTALWARLPVNFPVIRNPLSWAFAETVKAAELVPPHLPAADAPVERGTVFPAYLYLDKDGRRLALPSAVLADIAPEVLHRRLSVLTGYKVVDVALDEKGSDRGASAVEQRRVCGVLVRRSGAAAAVKPQRIPVEKGVVVAAGAVHSPQLLHDVAVEQKLTLPRPVPNTVALRDALALPLIFPSMPAVSADAFNARDTKSSAMWWLTQRGPFLAPLADTVASICLPEVWPDAELRIVLLPFGGRDAARFKSMGWDTVLGTPLQAYTMLLVVQGIDGLQHELTLDRPITPPGTAHARGLCPHSTAATLPAEVHRQVQEAFMHGMKACRRLTKQEPLTDLTLVSGAESIDFTLLVPSDEAKAVRLAQLSRQMPAKRTARNKAELKELLHWARSQIVTEAYMRSYIDAHAYWLGFASGSSEAFLSASMRVAGLTNVVVGDASAVTTTEWREAGKRDTLAAGSRSTTMHAAEKAVAELLRTTVEA